MSEVKIKTKRNQYKTAIQIGQNMASLQGFTIIIKSENGEIVIIAAVSYV